MRLLFTFIFFILFPSVANADAYRGLVKVNCEPSIGHFSFQKTGTYYYNAKLPDGFLSIDKGVSQTPVSPFWKTEPGSESFMVCSMPNHIISKNVKGLTFKVIRTKFIPPSSCSNCGMRRAEFKVTLNDKIITEGIVAYGYAMQIKNIFVDDQFIQICDSLDESEFETATREGKHEVTCKLVRIGDFLESD